MRHRRKRWQQELLDSDFDFYVKEPSTLKGHWVQDFDALHIEIGSGKGTYVVEMAKLYPNCLFVAIERMPLIGAYILRKLKEENLNNVKVIIDNADHLLDWFSESEIDVIHLNFVDPWPKKAHYKRRLTYRSYLAFYQSLLKREGEIQFKTDNSGLFEFSLMEFIEFGGIAKELSVDFRREQQPLDVITEYEQRFMDLGQPIYRCVWSFLS